MIFLEFLWIDCLGPKSVLLSKIHTAHCTSLIENRGRPPNLPIFIFEPRDHFYTDGFTIFSVLSSCRDGPVLILCSPSHSHADPVRTVGGEGSRIFQPRDPFCHLERPDIMSYMQCRQERTESFASTFLHRATKEFSLGSLGLSSQEIDFLDLLLGHKTPWSALV